MIKAHFKQSQFLVVSLKEGMFNNANVVFRVEFIDGASTVKRTVCGAGACHPREGTGRAPGSAVLTPPTYRALQVPGGAAAAAAATENASAAAASKAASAPAAKRKALAVNNAP